ncbi:redox-regulated ATPase YchF [Candidatus Woesearchaeota archaeon]|nr:redox-regulated ATPase YchF [Candidatus Woesearchaeota archaeon]
MIIGLVGKPSCGKSSTFKAATLADVAIANYPFTTIEKNEGAGHVRIECVDKEFGKQCNPRMGFCVNHQRFVPVKLVDVAGLVPDAHLGKGRGNQFLEDLREADALIHVIDCSGSVNAQGEPVAVGSYDPAKDIEFLEVELDMWYVGILSKGWEKFARTTQQEGKEIHKALGKQLSALGVTENMVKEGMAKLGLSPKAMEWSEESLKSMATFLRQKTKPTVIAANKIDVPCAVENFHRLKKQFPNHLIIPCSAESEIALREASKKGLLDYVPGSNTFTVKDDSLLNDKQKAALQFIKKEVLEKHGSTGIQDVLDTAVFKLLNYIAIFPGGVNKLEDQYGRCLPDCFLLRGGSTALDFAYKLHTDFGKNFIRAIDVKTKKTVGKEHLLKHRDVMEIVSGK